MESLIHQRCFNHALREAVARCPECGHFYCRECITEHDQRVICAACLKQLVRPRVTQRRAFMRLVRAGQCLFGIWLAWLFFFLIGEVLLALPDPFHETSVWQGSFWEEE